MHTQVEGLVAAFVQLQDVVVRLGAAEYCRRASNGDGSIGGHVRHCVDHAEALLAGLDRGVVDYDQRRRGTAVERDPAAGAHRLKQLRGRLDALGIRRGGDPLKVAVLCHAGGASTITQSSLAREVAFVQSHTIHHCAIIAILVRAAGATTPDHFGYAPATIAHLQETA